MASRLLYIECGSVLTRALVLDTQNGLRILATGESPTTAGYGGDDVVPGIIDASSQASEHYGKPLLTGDTPLALHPDSGVEDIVVATSIAGGALAAVGGVFRDISAESAQRAVLLGGASVSDIFAVNDARMPHEKRVILKQKPIDLLILAGGVDDGGANKTPGVQAVNVARLLSGGLPRSRSNPAERPTIVYAGSLQVRDEIAEVFSGVAPLTVTENVRPKLENENLEPARATVLEVFHKTTSQSRRYRGVGAKVSPAGYFVVRCLEEAIRHDPKNILVVDIGGSSATVYSTIDKVINRTILDLSGASSNGTGASVRVDNALKWVPFSVTRHSISSAFGNRLLRPGTLPETWEDVAVKLALCREEARAGLEHHKRLAVSLRGIQRKRQIWEIFSQFQNVGGQTLIDLSRVHKVILSGGWLQGLTSEQITAVAMEGLQTAGVTVLYADTKGVLALTGALLDRSLIQADQVWDLLTPLGTVISPIERVAQSSMSLGMGRVTRASIETGMRHRELKLASGRITRVPLTSGDTATITMYPTSGSDYGQGPGKKATFSASGGELGLIFDSRPRPLALPAADERRRAMLLEWWQDLDVFPEQVMSAWRRGERK